MSDRRIGCVVVQARPIDELRRDWQLVEDAGFHTLWVWDHLMAYPVMGVLLEAWTTLAAMAMATSRIRIGPLVTNITYRNPALLAKEAITVDHLSGGRLELGIGAAGTRADDALVSGVPTWPVAERVERFSEFVDVVSQLTSGRTEHYEGRFYSSGNFSRGPWPVQDRLPLTIAAHGPRTMRVVAQHGDSWSVSAGFGRSFDDLLTFLRDGNARLDDLAAAAGRSPGDIRRSLLVGFTGMEWWTSQDALDDFVGRVAEAGTVDLDFSYPPRADIAPSAYVDRVASLL